MNRNEFIALLREYEWSDFEFKEARRAAPKSTHETVSAFANRAGGRLVSGVRDDGGMFEIVGVIEVDKVQCEFPSTFRSGGKINRMVAVREDVVETDGKTLLVFHFLHERGFVVGQGDRLAPTGAAVLLIVPLALCPPKARSPGRRLPVHQRRLRLVDGRRALERLGPSGGDSRPGVAEAHRRGRHVHCAYRSGDRITSRPAVRLDGSRRRDQGGLHREGARG